jgi:hypothetical protein
VTTAGRATTTRRGTAAASRRSSPPASATCDLDPIGALKKRDQARLEVHQGSAVARRLKRARCRIVSRGRLTYTLGTDPNRSTSSLGAHRYCVVQRRGEVQPASRRRAGPAAPVKPRLAPPLNRSCRVAGAASVTPATRRRARYRTDACLARGLPGPRICVPGGRRLAAGARRADRDSGVRRAPSDADKDGVMDDVDSPDAEPTRWSTPPAATSATATRTPANHGLAVGVPAASRRDPRPAPDGRLSQGRPARRPALATRAAGTRRGRCCIMFRRTAGASTG